MDLSEEEERREKERDLEQPGLILLQSLLGSISIKLDQPAQFSSSPDLIEGIRDVKCTIREDHGRKENCLDSKELAEGASHAH